MDSTLELLVRRLDGSAISRARVIPWSSPVPCFGDVSKAPVATLGLNPSNREFVDVRGRELDGGARRFHTLRSLGLTRWSQARARHLQLIRETCSAYFFANPYDTWFRALDQLISGTGMSYYSRQRAACHLDLIPYATKCKWTALTTGQRTTLLGICGDALGMLLRDSAVQLLILNGQGVVKNFERIAGVCLGTRVMHGWTLPRSSGREVLGRSYSGIVDRVAGLRLGRRVHVLGFNHNIQSSFGVTREVKEAIRVWIAESAEGALP